MGKFKVGDRIIQPGWHERDTCTVVSISETRMTVRDDRGCTGSYTHSAPFVLVKPTITIEPGKHYRLRNGKVTGRTTQGDIGFEALVDGQVKVFDKAGGAVFGGEDIVEAWVPKVGERVRFVRNSAAGGARYGCEGETATVVADGPTSMEKPFATIRLDGGETRINFNPSAYLADLEPLLVAAPAQQAVWVPAVGDKVVWLEPFKASMYTKGKEYLIHKKERGSLFITDDNDNPEHWWSDDNILRSFSLAVPLKIEAGRYYKTRDGRKVGPMEVFLSDMFSAVVDDINRVFQPNGAHGSEYIPNNPDYDLIAEWIDEPVVAVAASNDNVAKPKFKVGDRVRTDGCYTFDPNVGEVTSIEDDYINVKVDNDGYGGGLWAYDEGELASNVAPQHSTAGFTIPLVDEEPETLTLMVTADTAQAEAAFDRIIAKLKKIRKLPLRTDRPGRLTNPHPQPPQPPSCFGRREEETNDHEDILPSRSCCRHDRSSCSHVCREPCLCCGPDRACYPVQARRAGRSMTTFEPHRGPPLSAPLDYVPTAPVHKPRRAVRRATKAGLCAAAALTAGFFAPFVMAAGISIVVAWLAFCRLFYWWQNDD